METNSFGRETDVADEGRRFDTLYNRRCMPAGSSAGHREAEAGKGRSVSNVVSSERPIEARREPGWCLGVSTRNPSEWTKRQRHFSQAPLFQCRWERYRARSVGNGLS